MNPLQSEREFKPISPNPFIVGNPVRNPAMFFGREAEFALVQKRFKQSQRGSLLVFCGERRSGKTSILLQIQQGRLGPEFVPVLIDMQAMAVDNETEFLLMIAREILSQLGEDGKGLELPDFSRGSRPAAVFRDFVASVLRRFPDRKLLLLFDEYELLEDKIESGALTPDTLLILASVMENLSAFLVFTGSQHLDERRKDYWRILGKAHEYRRISYLQAQDAEKLIRRPVQGQLEYAGETVPQILRLTAGQAFYTQAVCQNLVDVANDERTHVVTEDHLQAVVEQIVDNPFPQMTFLWDTLERDHKLTFALLAESLEDPEDHASALRLVTTLRAGKYPLDLDLARISTALEALFKQELLIRDDATPAGFAFRMDLWRRWIRRMHSVWQVMREEGLEFRRVPSRRRQLWIATFGVVAVAAAGMAMTILRQPESAHREPTPVSPAQGTGFVAIEVEPQDARVEIDGRPVAIGPYRGALASGRDYEFVISADAFVDTVLAVSVAENETTSHRVHLLAKVGSVRVVATPAQASIYYDDALVGTGSALLENLELRGQHRVTLRLDGYVERTIPVQPQADTITDVSVQLSAVVVDELRVDTDPVGAVLFVDGVLEGPTPRLVRSLSLGPHRFRVELSGHVPVDTTIVVGAVTGLLRFMLARQPPGTIRLSGSPLARIYIDGQQQGSGSLPGGVMSVESGRHTVIVRIGDKTLEKEVDVAAGATIELRWSETELIIVGGSR